MPDPKVKVEFVGHPPLIAFAKLVEDSAERALLELDTPYGPRFWVTLARKKAALRELRHIRNEAAMVRRTKGFS